MKRVEVAGVRLEVPSQQPVVLLREVGTSRFLPIWVGSPEASSILLAQEGVEPPRPLTHDLVVSILKTLSDPLQDVLLTHVDDGVFYAKMRLQSGEEIEARPSDAIAVALRCDAPLLAAESLLDEAGVELDDDAIAGMSRDADKSGVQTSEAETRRPDAEKEMQEFREFLAEVSPEDFGGEQNPPSGGPS